MPGPALAVAAPIIGGVLGGLGGKSSARAANRPQTTRFTQTLTPFGGTGRLNDYLSQAGDIFSQTLGGLPSGPNPFAGMAANMMAMQAMQGIPQYSLPSGFGVSLGDAPTVGFDEGIWDRIRAGIPSGSISSLGVSLAGMTPEEAATYSNPDMLPPELLDITRGAFRGAFDPVSEARRQLFADESIENYARSVVPGINSSFSLGGRTGSYAQAAAQAMANEEVNESIQANIADMILGQQRQEQDRQMQGFSIRSSLENAARAALMDRLNAELGAAAALRGQQISSATQLGLGEASIMAQLAGQNADMELRRMLAQGGFDMEGQALGLQSAIQAANLDLARRGQQFGMLGGMFDMGNILYDQSRQRAFDPLSALGMYGNAILPPLAQFGTTSGYNTQQGMGISPSSGFLMGGLGGALSGLGAYNAFGGKNQTPSLGWGFGIGPGGPRWP